MRNGDDVFLGDAHIIVLREYVSQDLAEKMKSVRMPQFDDVRAPFNNRSSYFAFLGTNYQASATAFLRAPSLIYVALLVRAAIPSLVRMLPELVRQHQVSRWLFHQTWLCSPYCSIMGDISYAVFVDSHQIPIDSG
ncbi:hypothetical protein Tco_1271641 [Tanacetum coccineum]